MTKPSGPEGDLPRPDADVVMGERRQLFNIAYRLLGSLSDAEDAVQEAYARWYVMPRHQQRAIAAPGAWLTTVTSRICLDLLGSARTRREQYVGEWLPEPVPESESAADPADRVTLDESVSMAFLIVLESMTPAERVTFTLHDVFRYSFAEVAEIVGRTPAACRQLAASARRRIRSSQPPRMTPTAQQARIVSDFKQAWAAKDIEKLIGLLDADAVAVADSGGIVKAALDPIVGAEQIARYYVDLASRAPDTVSFVERVVNGQPGLVLEHEGVTATVFAFDVVGARIKRIWAVRNPDKLGPWMPDSAARSATPSPDTKDAP